MATADIGTAKRILHGYDSRIRSLLSDPTGPEWSERELAIVFAVYGRMVGSCFIPLLELALAKVKGEAARGACEENLQCEVDDDHPGMLAAFIAQLPHQGERLSPDLVGWDAVKKVRTPLYEVIGNAENGIPGVLVLGLLETSSQVFIEWMERASARLGLQDTKYLEVHGIADIAHADEFAQALKGEADYLGIDLESIGHDHPALVRTYGFLEHIFTSHLKSPAVKG